MKFDEVLSFVMGTDFGISTDAWRRTEVNMPERMLISKREAAEILSISLRTLDDLVSEGKIAVRRIGRRVLISRAVLARFAEDLGEKSD